MKILFRLAACIIVICSTPVSLPGLDSEDLQPSFSNQLELQALDGAMEYEGDTIFLDALIAENILGKKHIMELVYPRIPLNPLVEEQEQLELDRAWVQIRIYPQFTYSKKGLEEYQKAVDDADLEQQHLAIYLTRRAISEFPKVGNVSKSTKLIKAASQHLENLERLIPNTLWIEELDDLLLKVRLGFEATTDVSLPENFKHFVRKNHLLKHLLYHRHRATLVDGVPALLVEGEPVSWKELQELIQLDQNRVMISHFYTYEGLVPGQTSTVIRPFQKRNPQDSLWRYLLEVVTANTAIPHVWVRLIENNGEVYSLGFWSASQISLDKSVIQHLIPEEGKLHSPDNLEVRVKPELIRETAIEITEGQFERAMVFARKFQESPQCYQILGIGGANCASFVSQLMQEIGLKLKTTSILRPFDNAWDVMKWQREVEEWREKKLKSHVMDGEEREAILSV